MFKLPKASLFEAARRKMITSLLRFKSPKEKVAKN